MSMETGLNAPASSSTPPPDPDAGKYEALRKELGIEAEQQEPAPAKEPAAEPDKREPAEQQEPEPQLVPRAEHENIQKALKEAREQARHAQEQIRAWQQVVEDARARRGQPAEAEGKKEEAPKIPSELEDPIGHFKAVNAQLQARLDQLERGTQQTAQQLQADQQMRQFHDVVVRAEQDINDPKSTTYKADYWDAVNHLEAQRVAELTKMYPDNAPYVEQLARQQGFGSAAELRAAVLNHDKQAVAVQALQMGMSPAEFYYQLAHTRGYTPKAAQQPPANGRAQQQIEAAKRGKAASVSLSGGEGRRGANDMSITELSNLFIEDPAAADEVWEHMRKSGRLG